MCGIYLDFLCGMSSSALDYFISTQQQGIVWIRKPASYVKGDFFNFYFLGIT